MWSEFRDKQEAEYEAMAEEIARQAWLDNKRFTDQDEYIDSMNREIDLEWL